MAKVDIKKYKRRAYRKKKVLGKFLKAAGKSEFKGILKETAKADAAAWKEVECLSCANCCKTMTPTYTKKDINRIAKHFKMSYLQFYDKWLKLDENKDIVNQSTPCQFLKKDNKCSIYEIRPADCAEFPHHKRRDFKYQAVEKTYTNNLQHCPATLVFVENLKAAIEADL
ncbi:MAG TPA: YkgJ family cysteine cluster protein [Chitinophagales bacterium]|nr:YkgJ family cysteine cluster protein [Chitinophagales bacterium]